MRIRWIWFLLVLPTFMVQAQKAIQLEKRGSLKTEKIYVGDVLVYKLKNDKRHWLEERIADILVDEGVIRFENRLVHVDSIYAIQFRDARNGVRILSTALTAFSYTWTFWTLVSLAYGESLTVSKAAIAVGSFAVGQGLKALFFKTHKIKGRKRLRLIDLTYYQPDLNRS